MDDLTIPIKFSSSKQHLLLLSHDELVSQLLKAQEKIKELESKQKTGNLGSIKSENEDSFDVPRYPINGKSQDESLFSYYSSDNSTDSMFDSPYKNHSAVVKEVQLKLEGCDLASDRSSRPIYHRYHDDDDFTVAYKYKGTFPNCDEDLSMPHVPAGKESVIEPTKIIIDDRVWNEDEHEGADSVETFPLIESPVLNTPPYEYIFLTKTNEAKYRIFLNQKLNKVFQEEILKLQIREQQLGKGQSQYIIGEADDDNGPLMYNYDENSRKDGLHTNHLDVHNQNHIVNCSSFNEVNDVNNSMSTSNVIHCFDPSDVDLELKKIFMEKPPITHKIVRRKSRRERGSSVPAVDSYYGTRDLNKVGHASYFIPTLTESERKAIGWKHEYHYGHWKYSTLNVPNPKTNQISLHPHVEMEGTNTSTQYDHHHNGALPHNPLHHHDIDLLEEYIPESENDSCVVPPAKTDSKHHSHCHHGVNDIENEDTLSFITLSGCSNEASLSCHIIPDKGTLRRILKWLLPCIKQNTKSTTNSLSTGESAGKNNQHSTIQKSADKTQHQIETLVEPSGKSNFPPQSNTCISFIATHDSGYKEKSQSNDSSINRNQQDSGESDASHNQQENKKEEQVDNHHHHGTHGHHHHHHGIFHWKNILTHHSDESMSVVGGDVIESIHDCFTKGRSNLDVVYVESINESVMTMAQDGAMFNKRVFNASSTDTESEDEHGIVTRKPFRKLKHCQAHFKLLTLKDLGYETDEVEDVVGTDHEHMGKDGPGAATLQGDPTIMDTEDIPLTRETLQGHGYKNQQCSKLGSRAHKPIRGNNMTGENGRSHRRGERRHYANRVNSCSSDMEGNDFDNDISSGGSGFLFSSLSISHQNSIMGSNFVLKSDSLDEPESRTEQEMNVIETRFLDPKDVLTPPMDRPLKSSGLVVDAEALPFVFDMEDLPLHNEEQQEQDDVIEWMGSDFVQDMREGLGLLSSCLHNIMKHDLMNEADIPEDAGRHSPDKVDGQHKITTLNDLEDQQDRNKNY